MATLETVFNSDTKIQILRTLAANNKSYSTDDLEKATTKDKTSIYKALAELRKENFLKVIQTEGKKKYYDIEVTLYTSEVPNFRSMVHYLIETEISQYNLEHLPKYPLNVIFDFRKKLINRVDEVDKIILFGSAVAGDYTLESDLDFYIVCEEAGVEVEDQIHEIAEGYDHEFSLIIKSEEQYNSDFEKPVSKLADSIIKDGFTTLYGETDKVNQYIKEGGE